MKMILITFLILISGLFCNIFTRDTENISEFSGKVALVTGASTGIGYSVALGLARQGANVIILARDSRPECYNGKAAEESIKTDPLVIKNGGKIRFIKADVSKIEEMKNVFEIIEKEYDALDIAVNNAAIGGYSSNLEDTPDDMILSQYDPILNNLYGVLISMKGEIKLFKKLNKSGASIVNISSYNGIRSCPGCSLYSASKYGIIGLTRSAALENIKEPYIRINVVTPGLVDTFLTRNQVNSFVDPTKQTWEMKCIPKTDELWKKYKGEFTKSLLSQRLIEPEEIADFVIYLSSSKASAISGAVLPSDLGESAK